MTEPITPETKVAKLLEVYPDLEEVLIGMAPAFGKLRNPVLRRSVAKVATLRQAAKVGGVSLAEMINVLREKAGISERLAAEDSGLGPGNRPAWAVKEKVANVLDARPMLDAGQHPLAQVLAALSEMAPGEVFELTAPFTPVPLIEVVNAKGFEAWWFEEAPEVVRVYIRSTEPDSSDSELTPLE